jgi:hypothetical protein
MTTSLEDFRRQDRLRALALLLAAGLAVAALVLGFMVWRAVAGGPVIEADAGEQVPLTAAAYGREVTVLTPGSEVTVTVGDPVESLAYQLVELDYDDPHWGEQEDLAAPEDGSLVPVTWKVQALGGFLRDDDPNPVDVRLVVGDERVDLASVVLGDSSASLAAADPTSVAVGVDGQPDLDDLAVEVEYEGLTQTAHVTSGEVDARVAQALYDGNKNYTSGCVEVPSDCELVAEPGSPLRPGRASFTASNLTLYPYDAHLGWADEGTLWAGVRLHLFGADSVENAAGDVWFPRRHSAPVVTLDGAKPVRREQLKPSRIDTNGRVVQPRELLIEQVLSLQGPDAPPDLPVSVRLPLTPVD